MSRRMSCSMTIDAVTAREKTVTRRHVDTWRTLKPGDRLTLIEKGRGLKKGEQQVVLAEVEVVDVRVEPITRVLRESRATAAEGLAHLSPWSFIDFWLFSHGYRAKGDRRRAWEQIISDGDINCRRIEWRYLDEAEERARG
jgi:hypothetical protein